MKVLIVGGGGREHALAWKCASSPRVTEVLVAPGNAGTAAEPKVRNVAVAAEDIAGLARLAARRARRSHHHRARGARWSPASSMRSTAAGLKMLRTDAGGRAARGLEGLRKEFLRRHGIPTARSATFTREQLRCRPGCVRSATPMVVKASGLAAGKGVVIAATAEEALAAVEAMFAGQFGSAGREVVIEEFLTGEEASFIVMADGVHVLPLATSQDHKRRDDGDRGPNTGGMGAYSPAPVVTAGAARAHHARGHRARRSAGWPPTACPTPAFCTRAS